METVTYCYLSNEKGTVGALILRGRSDERRCDVDSDNTNLMVTEVRLREAEKDKLSIRVDV